MKEKARVMGLSYSGLPTASLLATKGCAVLGVDIAAGVVDMINRAEVHLREPELDVLVRSAVSSGNLRAALRPGEADVFFITVPTPVRDGSEPDLSYVRRQPMPSHPLLCRAISSFWNRPARSAPPKTWSPKPCATAGGEKIVTTT